MLCYPSSRPVPAWPHRLHGVLSREMFQAEARLKQERIDAKPEDAGSVTGEYRFTCRACRAPISTALWHEFTAWPRQLRILSARRTRCRGNPHFALCKGGFRAGAPPAPKAPHFPHTEEVQGKVDPASLPDYVDVGTEQEEVMSVDELRDPDWMVQLQDELDALEVSLAQQWLSAHQQGARDSNASKLFCVSTHDLGTCVQDEATTLKERLNITAEATGTKGPARQVQPDSQFLAKLNVREAFMDCSDRARQRNANRKMTSLKPLSMNDGRHVMYSRSARSKLDSALILRIRWAPRALSRVCCTLCSSNMLNANMLGVCLTLCRTRNMRRTCKNVFECK